MLVAGLGWGGGGYVPAQDDVRWLILTEMRLNRVAAPVVSVV
jgi:hypothetical protein